MYDAQAAEIPVLGAEWPVDDLDLLNQFRAERFERSEITLAMPLGRLILRHIFHQDFEAAIHAAVVQIESETADLDRFSAALMLAGIDACIERLEHLVIARKQRLAEDLCIAPVKRRLNGSRSNGYASVNGRDVLLLREAGAHDPDEYGQAHQGSATNYRIVTLHFTFVERNQIE